jgi:hypothetical protein
MFASFIKHPTIGLRGAACLRRARKGDETGMFLLVRILHYLLQRTRGRKQGNSGGNMQQQSQSTRARVAVATSKSVVGRRMEAARSRSVALAADAERARYVEPGLARLLDQLPQATDMHGRAK